MFDAMVSLAFNVGIGAFLRSSVLRLHLAGDHRRAAEAFGLWNKAGGKILPGLVRRRTAEANLYREAM
jgi:lysozyme